MESTERRKFSAVQKTLLIFGSIILAFVVYYSIMIMLSPSRKLKEIETKFGLNESKSTKTDPRFYSDSTFLKLYKEKVFLQSRISMAETDSLYITLNLPDSSANLELSGVVVHKAKMSDLKISKILSTGDNYAVYSLLSSPMTIVNETATLKKEPLMVKMAPRDTSEFEPDIIPDTTDLEPVSYILDMDNGLRIFIDQKPDTITEDKHKLLFLDLDDRLHKTWSSIKSVAKFKVPEYQPFIRIELPKADARILYRAVPRHGQIAVFK